MLDKEDLATKNSGMKAILLCVILTVFSGFLFIAIQEPPSLQMRANSIWNLSLFSLLTAGLAGATFLTMVTSTTISERNVVIDNAFIVCVLSFIQSVFELFNYEYAFDPNLFYASSLAVNCLIIFNITQVLLSLIRISGRWLQLFSIGYALVALALGLTKFENLQMGGFEESIIVLGITVHGLLATIPVAVLALTYFVNSLRLSPNDFKQSIQKRLSMQNQNKIYMLTFYTVSIISLLTFVFGFLIYIQEFDSNVFKSQSDPHIPLSQFHLAWIPLTSLALSMLKQENSKNIQSLSLTSLVSEQAKRFMIRHHIDRKSWSTTLGMRTANFMLDHDPNEKAKTILPSYMVQIRQNQIHSFVQDILKDRLLDDRVVSNQIYGAIDPESSIRSCTDVLLMFTSLYIDGIPMVESRLKNLIRLLPILDPALAEKIDINEFEKNLGKIEWFFHLDFDWIDQHMSTSQNRTRYEVNIDNLKLRDRQRILSILEQHNLMGNFIWVGEKARERILLEAPYLANIIEAWPINNAPDEKNMEDSSVIFLMKFEQLIPRMQKYYNLEEVRKKLSYYDPSIESRRMINIIDLEIQQSNNGKSLLNILSLVDSYPWSGFKEKDLALDLVIKAFEKHKEEILTSQEEADKYLGEFVNAVKNIGYPSQEIHQAHEDKMRIRTAEAIRSALINPHDERFAEVWLLIATTPIKHYSKEETISLLEGINASTMSRQHKKSMLVVNKITEAFFNVSQELSSDEIPLITETCNNVAKFLVEAESNLEIFCFFIDAKIFLETNIKEDIPLSKETLDAMQYYFSQLYEKFGADSPMVTSLSMRWRILMNQGSNIHSAS